MTFRTALCTLSLRVYPDRPTIIGLVPGFDQEQHRYPIFPFLINKHKFNQIIKANYIDNLLFPSDHDGFSLRSGDGRPRTFHTHDVALVKLPPASPVRTLASGQRAHFLRCVQLVSLIITELLQ